MEAMLYILAYIALVTCVNVAWTLAHGTKGVTNVEQAISHDGSVVHPFLFTVSAGPHAGRKLVIWETDVAAAWRWYEVSKFRRVAPHVRELAVDEVLAKCEGR